MFTAWKFTPARRAAFLAALARTGSVRRAARETDLAESPLYRRRLKDAAFRADWDAAVATARAALDAAALGRAVSGWDVPVYSQGVAVTVVRRYSDRLLMMLLRAHAPHRYGGKAWREGREREDWSEYFEALAAARKRVLARRKALAAKEAAAAESR